MIKMQKADTDPIGFGLRYRATRHDPKGEWAAWQKLYPEIQFSVKVDIKIRGTGLIR
ncbi:Ger(x)C family spore germination C-terminal domain-containing protein [Paenibacillus phyllosphaerae]|uniref:Ger(x)C family spore germination C-terminal domain-containing protein n=1 Tax=Paenibacillus phyllosphaerae TaxID=274593 RepID=UPI0033992E28